MNEFPGRPVYMSMQLRKYGLKITLFASITLGALLIWSLRAPESRAEPTDRGGRIALGAHKAAVMRPWYDPKYVRLKYPGGDPGKGIGVCTDIVVRAYRHIGVDLQVLVHRDMRRNFHLYDRRRFGQRKPDRNIDHRRVRNLMHFFRRKARSLPLSIRGKNLKTWKPGDIVIFDLNRDGGWSHIGIVSMNKSSSGVPLVFHHLPVYPREDNALEELKIVGHFRY